MFVEVQRRRRLLYFKTLMMFLTAASMAQGGNGQLPPAPDPFGNFSLKDFKLVDQNFGKAQIRAEEKNEIALTLATALDHAFGEERSYADAKAGSDRPTSRQRREILDQSSILAIAALPNNSHLYVVQIIISPGMPRGPNVSLKSLKLLRRVLGFLAKASGGA